MADRAQLYNDSEEALRLAFDGRLSTLWTAMPGIVNSVDLTKCTCTVQPAIKGVVEDEDGNVQSVTLPLLVDVPIVFPSVSGFALTLPLVAGDEVLVVFAARAIDSWWQSGGVQKPVEARMHDLSDGFAFPARMSQAKKLSNISATGAQLRSADGARFIEVNATGIAIQGNVTITGNLSATQVSEGSIRLGTHKHLGVTTGGGTSGGPTP